MKLIIPIVLLAMVGCTNAKKEQMSMPGAYNMISQSVFDGVKDTTYTSLKEFKIFTDKHMMYVNISPADSISRFGVGFYMSDSGNVHEHVIFGASDSTSNSNPSDFKLVIEKTDKGYKQVIPSMMSRGVSYKLTEEYETVSTDAKTPLDGTWKGVKFYTVTGKDTVENKMTQYKTYFAGNFMFGHTYQDSVKKLHTGIGYGTFSMNGTNKVKENVTVSTYYQIRDKSFDVDIEMTGTDEFKQTITEANGDKNVEIYQRLKQ
jgi:hypothetical protein